MKTKIALLVTVITSILFLGTGCLAVALGNWEARDFEHPDTNEKSIILQKAQIRPWLTDKVVFPKGVYKPELKTKTGILYRAPLPIISNGLGLSSPQYGGIYIPNEIDKNQEQGMYFFPGPGLPGIYRLGPSKIEFKYLD